MPQAYIDRVDSLSQTERLGVVRSLTRKARIIYTFLEDAPVDFSILDDALNYVPPALTTITAFSDPIFALPQYIRYGNLYLIERNAELVEGQSNVVDVVLKYEHFMDGPYQQLVAQTPGVYGKGRCSIVEKSTNFFYPNGDRTKKKIQILVGHTFNSRDTGIVGCTLDPELPFTVIQGGEVNLPFPQSNYKLTGLYSTNDPFGVAKSFVAKVNDGVWLGQPAYTWICSEASFEVIDITDQTNHVYKFEFEWQHNVDTWFPAICFNDQRTGRPPADVLFATTKDDQGVLRLVNNPYLAKKVAAAVDPAAAGVAAGAAAGRAIVNAAIAAARAHIAQFGDSPPNLGAQTAAIEAANSLADTDIDNAEAVFGGESPFDFPGGPEGGAAGSAQGVAAAQDAIQTTLDAGPSDSGILAVNASLADILAAANSAGSAAGAAAGALAAQNGAENKLQPAGVWQVPALEPTNFNQMLATLFEP